MVSVPVCHSNTRLKYKVFDILSYKGFLKIVFRFAECRTIYVLNLDTSMRNEFSTKRQGGKLDKLQM